MATDTTRSDNRLLISVWIMFAIGLGIYFKLWDVVNEATGGVLYRTRADVQTSQQEAEAWAKAYQARTEAERKVARAKLSASE